MPCESGPGPSYHKELKDAEKELCGARWLLLQLQKKLVGQELPDSLVDHIEEQRAAQLTHRLKDRQCAANQVQDELDRVNKNINRILELNGTPAHALLNKKDELSKNLREIEQVTNDQLLEGSWCNHTTIVDSILSH